MRQRRAPKSGFTLVELLVVIAIIVLLAAIVWPVVQSSQRRARQVQCQANLGEVAVAIKAYLTDYRGFPLGAVGGNVNGLPDDTGASPGGGNYNLVNAANGTRCRVSGLFPNYLEQQKTLICPDEAGDSALVSAGGTLNGQATATVLNVGGDGSASSYDDMYNAFGYDPSGTPLLVTPALGRSTMALANRYAPGQTIVTACREHEAYYDADAAINLLVRVGGGNDKVVRASYDWSAQAEQVFD